MNATTFDQKQWELQAKRSLAEIGWKNIKTRGQVFAECVNTMTSYVITALNMPTQAIRQYCSPIFDVGQSEHFLQWIYTIKIPNPKKKKNNCVVMKM